MEKLEAAVRELTEDEEDESSKFSVEELAIILDMDEEAVSYTHLDVYKRQPKLQVYLPIFSLTPKASGSTRLQSCEVHWEKKNIKDVYKRQIRGN